MNDRQKVGLEVDDIISVVDDFYVLVNKELIREERSCFFKTSSMETIPALLLTGMVMTKDHWRYRQISTTDGRDPKGEWIPEEKIYFTEATDADIEKINDVYVRIRGESQKDHNDGILNVNEISRKIRERVNKEEADDRVTTREKRRHFCKVDACNKQARKSGVCRYHQVHQAPEQTRTTQPNQTQKVHQAQQQTHPETQQTQHPAIDHFQQHQQLQQLQQLQFQQFQMHLFYEMQQFQSFQQYQLRQLFPMLNSQLPPPQLEQHVDQPQPQQQPQQQQLQQQQQPSEEQTPSEE